MNDDHEWTEEELAALRQLGDGVEPDWRLEDRVVARLRRDGLLRTPRMPFWRSILAGPRLAWASAAVAFTVAVFFAGVTVGQRSTAESLRSFHEDAMMDAAARVQETGSAYVTALAAMGRLAATAESGEVEQGREVALAALYSAAEKLVELDPEDPLARRLLQGLQTIETADRQVEDDDGERRVVWF